MVMIYHNAEIWNTLSQQEKEAVWSEGAQRWRDLIETGEGIVGEPLAEPRSARIIRPHPGFPEVTVGPYSEAKEQFVGFMLLDVASEARAVEIATSWPEARYSTLEVRLVRAENAK